MDVNSIIDLVSSAMSHDVTKWTIAFCIAAWVHSGQVKRELRKQFTVIATSMDNLGIAIRKDMSDQARRIENLTGRVDQLEKPK